MVLVRICNLGVQIRKFKKNQCITTLTTTRPIIYHAILALMKNQACGLKCAWVCSVSGQARSWLSISRETLLKN